VLTSQISFATPLILDKAVIDLNITDPNFTGLIITSPQASQFRTLHRKLQRPAARRVAERNLIPLAAACPRGARNLVT